MKPLINRVDVSLYVIESKLLYQPFDIIIDFKDQVINSINRQNQVEAENNEQHEVNNDLLEVVVLVVV